MRILHTFSFVFIAFSALSQGQLSFKLIDEQGSAIEYANFRLFSPKDSSVVGGEYSDVNGKIAMNNIDFGEYYGKITFFGFEDKTINSISFSADQRRVNLGYVVLNKLKSQEFEEVVVKRNTNLMESSIDKRTYNVDEDMTSIGGRLTDVLNNIPSVEVNNNENVSLQKNKNVTILINGKQSTLTNNNSTLD